MRSPVITLRINRRGKEIPPTKNPSFLPSLLPGKITMNVTFFFFFFLFETLSSVINPVRSSSLIFPIDKAISLPRDWRHVKSGYILYINDAVHAIIYLRNDPLNINFSAQRYIYLSPSRLPIHDNLNKTFLPSRLIRQKNSKNIPHFPFHRFWIINLLFLSLKEKRYNNSEGRQSFPGETR